MTCPRCKSTAVIKKGFFKKKNRSTIQRFFCKSCRKKFSTSTLLLTYKQQVTKINAPLFKMLCSGVSFRRCALNLNVCYMTVYRRFLWMAGLCGEAQKMFLLSLSDVKEIYLDEMESIEHTKLKPVSIPLLIDDKYRILGIVAGEIPAKGHLAKFSREKYGERENLSSHMIRKLLSDLPEGIRPLNVRTDGKTTYPDLVSEKWPAINHEVFSRKSTVRKEQPHLKAEKKVYDPMFVINQRCAKLRRDIGRLARRSWVTTKKVENLTKHLLIYAVYNNALSIAWGR